MRLLFLFLLACSALTADARQLIHAADLLKIRRIMEVDVARDGSFAVYGVQSIHAEPPAGGKGEPVYSYRTHLFRVDLSGPDGSSRQLTWGDRRDSQIAISPDGRMLAFVRQDPSNKKSQVWLLPLDGGEARPLTRLEYGAANPIWHPSGKGLLVSSEIPISKVGGKPPYSMERPGRDWFDWDASAANADSGAGAARPDGDRRSIRNWLEGNAARGNPVLITRLAFQGELELEKEQTITTLFFIDLETGNARPLTKGFISYSGCSYSSDGRRIACVGSPQTREHPDRVRRSAIWLLEADGSQARAVLDDPAESFTAVRFFPNSDASLVVAQQTDQPTDRQARLARFHPDSARLEWLAGSWESAVTRALPASDGAVLFTSPWHGGFPLLRAAAGKLQHLVTGPVGVGVFAEGAGRLVYSLTSVENPNELYLRDTDGATRRLTSLNAGWLASKQLSFPQEKWIERPDGTRVQMWMMNPTRAQAGKKYPWVLEMHGGPSAMWGPGEFTMWHEFQLLCAWGYGVVYANPRGSGGYGYAFQRANYKNWGAGPAGDVLAALDEAVRSNPLVDASRLFLTGGSYAGYLTAWIVSHDHRFKAAVAQRGVYDLTTFYGEGNAFRLLRHELGGVPYEAASRRALEAESPFTYVSNIRTPLLILHGSKDLRTGVSQSEMLYRALKDQGKPVEYVRYPDAGHELTRSGAPLQRMDHLLRIIEFFERWAQNDEPAPSGEP